MFIQNKYTKWYYSIINRSRGRVNVCYTEKHHIIPKCMGGNNKAENIAILTAKEHFICHLLLVQMTTGKDKQKMSFAVHMFLRGNSYQYRVTINSKTYEYIKRIYSENVSTLHKGKIVSQESIDKRIATMKINDKKRTLEMKKHQSNIGKKQWLDNREFLLSCLNTPEVKLKQSISAKVRGISKGTLKALQKVWESFKGEGNPRARKIMVTSPTNVITIVHGEFQKFCTDNKLPFSTMCAKLKGRIFTSGKSVGWDVIYID